jgi:sorbitol/mannitol transport system substrate-binding protein
VQLGEHPTWAQVKDLAAKINDPKDGVYGICLRGKPGWGGRGQGGLRAGADRRRGQGRPNWLWAWALAIPAGSKKVPEAQKFISWATSKQYIELVGKTNGWGTVPTGTRKSTYPNPDFLKAAKFAPAEKAAIDSANPNDSTLPKSPYVGVQFAAIPEFQAIGIAVGQQMSAALAGKTSVDAALKASQTAADREMKKAGYYK